MPFYDFRCEECKETVEEFFKIADEKIVECTKCGNQMKQVILKAPGLSDPGGIGQKWTNDGYQMRDVKSGNLRNVTEKWEKGKNIIRGDVHKDDPNPVMNTVIKREEKKMVKDYKDFCKKYVTKEKNK